jgi:hypothetical protein
MSTFLGYFIVGLILAAPLWWLSWRFRLGSLLVRMQSVLRRRKIQLPPQLDGLVILGKRQPGTGKKP